MKRLTKIGLIVTGTWALAFAIVIYFRAGDAIGMDLNEWGDFLAGAFAPLALFWLVIGYFQHGEELRLNTRALETQQEELKRQVEETAHLVDATRDEVRFLQERERREAMPDIVSTAGGGFQRTGMHVNIQNRGGEIRDIRVNYEGPCELKLSPSALFESNGDGALVLNYHGHPAPDHPIRFSINCVDLIGYRHTIGFDWYDTYEIRKTSHTWERPRDTVGT